MVHYDRYASGEDKEERFKAQNYSAFWHYFNWRTEKSNAVVTKCEELQNEVYRKLPTVTPVRKNPIKTHIVANRQNGKTAVRKDIYKKEQAGRMRVGWIKSNVILGGTHDYKSVSASGRVYAVRNKNRPEVVHLINFDRRHYSHGKPSRAGILKGSGFVDKVQEEANAKLNSEIKKIFEKE